MRILLNRKAAILGLLFFSFSAHSEPIDFSLMTRVEVQTRDACQTQIDEDTVGFKKCVLEQASNIKKMPNKKISKLGVYYYGWLASIVASKNGIQTSEETAFYFLPKFRSIQKELKISDLDLCHTIPGDCVSRNARMIQMENRGKAGSPK
jgi:hypothetical protein